MLRWKSSHFFHSFSFPLSLFLFLFLSHLFVRNPYFTQTNNYTCHYKDAAQQTTINFLSWKWCLHLKRFLYLFIYGREDFAFLWLNNSKFDFHCLCIIVITQCRAIPDLVIRFINKTENFISLHFVCDDI